MDCQKIIEVIYYLCMLFFVGFYGRNEIRGYFKVLCVQGQKYYFVLFLCFLNFWSGIPNELEHFYREDMLVISNSKDSKSDDLDYFSY